MKHETQLDPKESAPVDSDYEAQVSWDSQEVSVRMTLDKSSLMPRPRWKGHLGLITIVHDVDVLGGPMVFASAEFPAVLDPLDGYTHSIDGGYHKDVRSAVAGLQRAVSQVREWLDGLVSRISDETGDRK